MSKSSVRFLSIILIVVLFAGAWYTLFNDSRKLERQYDELLETARAKRRQNLYEEARDRYLNALELYDSMELRDEIAEFYLLSGKNNAYVDFCESTRAQFPKEGMSYERLAEYYRSIHSYYSCFELINTARRRGVASEKLDTLEQEIAYLFELTDSYDDVTFYSSGYCAVRQGDGYWGFIDTRGRKRLSAAYQEAGCFTSSGYAMVKDNKGRCLLIDKNGRGVASDAENREIEDFTDLISGKVALKYGGSYHYCDADFRELFGSYDAAGAFNCGVAAVREGNGWRLINESGQYVTDTVYEDVRLDDKGIAFRNNVGFVKLNGKYILIDVSGAQVGSESWDDADAFNAAGPAAVKSGASWGYVNSEGELVWQYSFHEAKSFANQMAAVNQGGYWGYIDENFETQIGYDFGDALDFNDKGSAFVRIGSSYTLLKLYRLSEAS